MNEAAGTSYDEVLYESQPLYATHPDCLATAARLRGIAAPPASDCRVLELGCGTGGNLIPLAYGLPASRFVGIDLSARQIEVGRQLCARLGLGNIDLAPVSIMEVDRSWGQFDYIICHGVFSWVPRHVQDHILWICRHLLSERGVAYVSYNTYPGWHLRNVVRDLMKYHAARFDQPQDKIVQARLVLELMAKATAKLEGPMSRLLADESTRLGGDPDYYLFHEHLEEHNAPLYFHQFVARARQAGLEYLSEAWHHIQIDHLEPEIREGLQAISSDWIELEQFMDFVRSRTFRRTLLCHGHLPIQRTLEPELLEPMLFTALAQPLSDEPDAHSAAAEQFRLDNGTTATTNNPLLKTALVELARRWPRGVPFGELLAVVCDASLPRELRASARPALAALLARSYLMHLVAVHQEPFPFTCEVSFRPRASGLARLQAAWQPKVTNLRHRVVELPPLDLAVLQLADGTRTLAEIADHLPQALWAEGGEGPAGEARRELAGQSLHRLARSALLEG